MPDKEQSRDELLGLAAQKLAGGEPEQAALLLNEALHLSPHDPDLYRALGQVYESLGQFSEAEKVYERFAETAPESAAPPLLLARLFQLSGDASGERRALERAAGMQNGEDRQIALGHLAFSDQRWEEALTHYLNAREWNAEDAWLDLTVGTTLLHLSRNAEALEYLEKAAEATDVSVRSITLHNIGVAEERLGHRHAAVAAYEAAIILDPDYYKAYIGLSALEARMGRFLSAWRHFRAALRLSR